jgi:hypothetical protein
MDLQEFASLFAGISLPVALKHRLESNLTKPEGDVEENGYIVSLTTTLSCRIKLPAGWRPVGGGMRRRPRFSRILLFIATNRKKSHS